MKLLKVDLPGIVVRKAGNARVAVPGVVNGPHGMHWAAKAGRAKKQRTAAEKRLQALLGGKVLLVVCLTRVAPRALDDDNLRPALKAYRDGVAGALGLRNDRPGWLSWEYKQEQCSMGEPERVRLEVTAVGESTWGIGVPGPVALVAPQPPPPAGVHEWFDFNGLPCCKRCGVVKRRDGKNPPCKGVLPKVTLRAAEPTPVRAKAGPKPAYTPPRLSAAQARQAAAARKLLAVAAPDAPGSDPDHFHAPPRTEWEKCSVPTCTEPVLAPKRVCAGHWADSLFQNAHGAADQK